MSNFTLEITMLTAGYITPLVSINLSPRYNDYLKTLLVDSQLPASSTSHSPQIHLHCTSNPLSQAALSYRGQEAWDRCGSLFQLSIRERQNRPGQVRALSLSLLQRETNNHSHSTLRPIQEPLINITCTTT